MYYCKECGIATERGEYCEDHTVLKDLPQEETKPALHPMVAELLSRIDDPREEM